MQSAFTVRHTESNERWQLYTYNCWQVKCCAEVFNNIGLLSQRSCIGSAVLLQRPVSIHRSPDYTEKHFHHSAQKDTIANDPYLSYLNFLLTLHV